jgi:hypothetical protein
MTEELRFDFWQEQEISVCFQTSKPALGPPRSLLKLLPSVLSPGKNRLKREATTHLNLLSLGDILKQPSRLAPCARKSPEYYFRRKYTPASL